MSAPPESALPLFERLGLAVLRRTPARPPVASADDPIHVLNEDEQRELRLIERRAVLLAGLAGALSGGATAAAAIWAHRFIGPDGVPLSAADGVRFWAVVIGVTIIASIFEIGFLYWDALRSVHAMATAAGLGLSGEALSGAQREVALALARAALELPNPPVRAFGVNPRRESIGWVVAAGALLYRAKIMLTTLLLKAVLRSLLGRVMGRAMFELVTIPVTAIWNAVVCFLVVREARLRTMGPSAASELVRFALLDHMPSPDGRVSAFRSVASAIVRTKDLHPNHVALFRALAERLGPADVVEIDDSSRFLTEIAKLDPEDGRLVLRLLVIAAVLDGRITRAERRLLTEAFAATGRTLSFERVDRLRRAFMAGRGIDYKHVTELVDAR